MIQILYDIQSNRDLLCGLIREIQEVAIPVSIPPFLPSNNKTEIVFKLAVGTVFKNSLAFLEAVSAHEPTVPANEKEAEVTAYTL